MVILSDMEGYDKGYQDGKKDTIDNVWTNMIDKIERIKQSNPPEFLAKCMNIRVPDCNDCGHLNYIEKEQRDYGINSYKKIIAVNVMKDLYIIEQIILNMILIFIRVMNAERITS